MATSGPVVLLTDFGLVDAYVGIMKGVILTINPEVTLVDLSHAVPPQDVAAGAWLLASSYRYFPADSIFVAVVDPGVGSSRRAVAVKTSRGTFVAPDNGLLTPILGDFGVSFPRAGGVARLEPTRDAPEGTAISAVALANAGYFLSPVSATFHGRDVFAPVAAHLSRGVPLASFGPPLDELVVLPGRTLESRTGEIVGEVVTIDHFGNAITNIPGSLLDDPARTVVSVAGQEIVGVSHHYAERPGLLALVGSAGCLEVAVNGGSAAALGIGVGDRVAVRQAFRHA